MKKVLSFFRSMRFGMILLILVMGLSLAGSLVPQREQAMTYVNAYGAQTATVLIALGVTDIFHTWVFYTLEGLLCLNLMLCSLLRFPKIQKAAEALQKKALETQPDHPLPAEQRETMEAFLTGRRFRRDIRPEGTLFFKNGIGFYGSFMTHLSILLILIFGSLVLMTPEILDETVMPGEALEMEDGTRISLLSFHILNAEGELDYASMLRAESADGTRSAEQEIRVNEPMRFLDYKIYQQTYGTAGAIRILNEENEAEDIQYLTEPCFLSIDGKNGVYFHALYPGFLQDEAGNYTLITSTAGGYLDPVYHIESISDGMSASVLAFPGETLHFGAISFTFLSPVEYPGLRIKRVSSALYSGLYFSFGLMVMALYLCFFAVPVCIKTNETGYAVCSPKNQQGLMIDLQALLEKKESDQT